MIEIGNHIVNHEPASIRLVDFCIGLFPQLATKNAVKKAIKRGELLHNGNCATTGNYIKKDDVIQLVDKCENLPKEFKLPIDIVYEDDHLVVVNKPSGLVVSGNQFKTLENAMVNSVVCVK